LDPGFRASLPLDGFVRPLHPSERLSQQIRMVLETRPGQIPWRPEFGCDLTSLIGEPATAQRLQEARWRVEQAIEKWLPGVELLQCTLRVTPTPGAAEALKNPSVPLAESAMLSLGVQANLEVLLELQLPDGSFLVSTEVTP